LMTNETVGAAEQFLGLTTERGEVFREALEYTLKRWFHWRSSADGGDASANAGGNTIALPHCNGNFRLVAALAELLDNYGLSIPFFSSRYIAHMRADAALPALLGHIVAVLYNPNNISSDSAGIGAQIEREGIECLRTMVGYPSSEICGHFTSGGTISNFEGLVRARYRTALWLALGSFLRDARSEEHTSELQSQFHLLCRL